MVSLWPVGDGSEREGGDKDLGVISIEVVVEAEDEIVQKRDML